MPRYCYRCKECNIELVITHLMNESREDCPACEGRGTLVKIPSLTGKLVKKDTSKAGEVVKQYIKDAKEEIKQEKKNLKIREAD